MKKEYIILILLIIGLSAYIGFKKDNQVHYELPQIPQVDTASIDRIEISKADRLVVLDKAEKGWTVTDKKFAATKGDVEQMLGTLKQIKLSALVSEAKDFTRYELDEPHAVKVKAFAGDRQVACLIIGKTAPSYNHTFICLGGQDQTVYQANGNFKAQFDKDAAGFRDKKILEFEPESIKEITLEKQGKTVILTKTKTKTETETETEETVSKETKETQTSLAQKKTPPKKMTWKAQNDSTVDQTIVSDLLSSLSKLECQDFLADDKAKELKEKQPSYKILLENDKTFVLNLFNNADNQDVSGACSYTPYAFTLTSYQAEDIGSYTDKLLGITQHKDSAKPDK